MSRDILTDPAASAPDACGGTEPLIARLYEARAAEELAVLDAVGEGAAGAAGVSPAVSAAAEDGGERDPLEEGAMPFIGRVLDFQPGAAITVVRRLHLAEDLYLADHAFVHAPGIKPLSACMPVLPLTMSLEVMAEAAACLAPGLGLVGFEDVRATRWIELADTDSITLRIGARVAAEGGEDEGGEAPCRIAVAIHLEQQAVPAISATALFASAYRVDLQLTFTEFTAPYRLPLSAEEIYRQRHMFHGPRFQCLSGEIVIAERGAAAELLVKSPDELFRSVRRPQLLLDPALLDGIGQFIGVWAMQHERYVFPIGFRKLELYRPTPPAGTRVPFRIEITRDEAKTLYADVEIQDGAGGVWMRIKEWGNWKFRWARRLVDFRRMPARNLLAATVSLPELPAAAVCCMVASEGVAGFDATLLARHYLHVDEMASFVDKGAVPRRQLQWLLGRVAAKDAVRAWLAGPDGGDQMLHPAAFVIDNDAAGQPLLRPGGAPSRIPFLSISHCDGRAVAIASTEAVGVDVEPICPREPVLLEAIATSRERALLEAVAGVELPERNAEWVTRLWCAKEAAGKLRGTGVRGSPKHFEAIAIDADGGIGIRPRDDGRVIRAHTVRDGDFVIAWAAERTLRAGSDADVIG